MRTVEDWLKELDNEEKAHKEYRDRAQKVVDRYEDEEDRDDHRFNILWSNVEVLHSAVYEKKPTPDIRRRFLDRDKAGKQASEVAERAVSFAMDVYDYDGTMDVAVDDYLIAGLGQVRLRYTPYFESGEPPRIGLEARGIGIDDLTLEPMFEFYNGEDRVEECEVDEMGAFILGEPEEELIYAEVTCEPVNWKRFRWEPASRWEDVDWCCIEHYMDFDELEENYGKDAHLIPLGYDEKGEKTTDDEIKSRARIFEIFDKKNRVNIEIADGYNEILRETEDPLGLEHYYPFPKPLFSTLRNGKFIPIPDYVFYQDQAAELDEITGRINLLTKELKYRGVYDGSFKDLVDVSNLGDGEFQPIDDFQERFNGQGDLGKFISAMPLDEIIRALQSLYASREEVKSTIYEITGIADIMRGSTKSNETLGAQQLKTQFGSMRLQKRQKKVAQFNRDVVRLMVEVMVENFDPEILQQITGMEISPEVEAIFRSDLLRSYRIDIETDSTITEDANEEKQKRIELVVAVTDFVEKVAPQVQAGIMPMNVAKELLGFAMRGFKIGRTLEDTLDEMGGQDQDPRIQQMQSMLEQRVQQIQAQAGQYVQKVQQDSAQKVQALEGKLFDAQKQLAISNERTSLKMTEAQMKTNMESEARKYKAEIDAQVEVFKAKLDMLKNMPQPDESKAEFNQVVQSLMQALTQINDNNMQAYAAMTDGINRTGEGIATMSEYMSRPAKVVRDENNRVVGATRD